MKSHVFTAAGLLTLLTSLGGVTPAAPAYRLPRQEIGVSAVHSSGGTFGCRASFGSSPVGWDAGASFQQGIGFWYTLPRPLITAIGDDSPEVRFPSRLDQNTPNPFNPRTTIRFAVSTSGPVKLELFDLRGRRIAILLDQEMTAGEHEVVFHPTDLASGVYVYRLRAGSFRQSRCITLIK